MKLCKLRLIAALICCILCIGAQPCSCNVVYVNASQLDNTGDGLSWATAKKSIQAGINAAVAGDEVWVASGTYSEYVTLNASVSLYGGFPTAGGTWETRNPAANSTLIDAKKTGSVITINTSGSLATMRGMIAYSLVYNQMV